MSGLTILNIPTVQTTLDPTSVLYAVTGAGVFQDTRLPVSVLMSNLTGVLNQPFGGFYAGQGGVVNRVQDRLFIGDACANTGAQVEPQPDWLTQFEIAVGAGISMQLATMAMLTGKNPENLHGFVSAAQNLYTNIAGLDAISITTKAINNNTTLNSSAFGTYTEVYRMQGVAGGAFGHEIDTINFAGDVSTDPYQQSASETIAIQLAAGAGLPSAGQFPAQCAINIQNNNSTFDIGLNFGSSAISGATGTSGTGVAIAMGIGHTIQWYGSSNIKTSGILSLGTTASGGIRQIFNENQVGFQNGNSNFVFQVFGNPNSVNYVSAQSQATGLPPQLNAAGSDTNINLYFVPKGSGVVQFGTFTGTPSAVLGYITIADSTGTLRKLAVLT